jgi:hypothetical protein
VSLVGGELDAIFAVQNAVPARTGAVYSHAGREAIKTSAVYFGVTGKCRQFRRFWVWAPQKEKA